MEVLIIDDWGLAVLTAPEPRDLLEIFDDRHSRATMIVTSQLPVKHGHKANGDPTLADAILDVWFITLTGSNAPEKACEKPLHETQALTP